MMQRKRKFGLKQANRHALQSAKAAGLQLPPGFDKKFLAYMDKSGEQVWAEAFHQYGRGERVKMSPATGMRH